ncbi:hypothetical protein SLNWT_1144 [Streptomyces albus]|uniref:Uncharacterized protein n=1 Tax=Streptomyces albus (strain ATCC 21838 / DSM 41398 / FERM P-419 / JCM 4703 / NBRC 107858) TaxID=1081613 RepID=A0A0B5EQE4_STRA4|nr:hypothetical protein SLNWT_1144 [Streptomyces albus]AOU75835.1 hypothetical protein SLNHY_1144 [Streptomyces albus]AYN31641.1 hypothetical protein DUI70_1138 [Streptomyces albus]
MLGTPGRPFLAGADRGADVEVPAERYLTDLAPPDSSPNAGRAGTTTHIAYSRLADGSWSEPGHRVPGTWVALECTTGELPALPEVSDHSQGRHPSIKMSPVTPMRRRRKPHSPCDPSTRRAGPRPRRDGPKSRQLIVVRRRRPADHPCLPGRRRRLHGGRAAR